MTSHVSLGLMAGLPEYLAANGWDVQVVSSPGPRADALARSADVTVHRIDMSRDPSLLKDVRALAAWVRLVRTVRPDVTSVGTPKAGLLGGVAAWLMRVPKRVYLLRGLRYETSAGFARHFLKALERIACGCASEVVAVSGSLKGVAIADGIVPAEKVVVIGSGSSNGVDVDRFATSTDERLAAKAKRWGADAHVPVVGYIGRIHPDKGLDLLADAAAMLAARGVPGRLLVVGSSDSESGEELRRRLRESGFTVEFTGSVDDVAPLLKVMDVLCLPTKREGFPNVVLEAAAAGIPTVATAATGIPDAIVDGVTGLVLGSRDADELVDMIGSLLLDDSRRTALGSAARQFVVERFSRNQVWENYAGYYGTGIQLTSRNEVRK